MITIPEALLDRKREIAERIIKIETKQQGAIRLSTNPIHVNSAYSVLESMGFKKRFLATKQQCVIDCFLTSVEVCDRFLFSTILAGPFDIQTGTHRWNGLGNYQGWSGPLALTDFSREWNQKALFIVNLEPVFSAFEDLLQPIQPTDRTRF